MLDDIQLLVANPDIEEETEVESTDTTDDDSLWRVLIHNDDVTPMDFVILILLRVFGHTVVFAEAIMWEAHTKGSARVAVLPKAEAHSKVNQAHFAAQLEGFPLKFTLEPEK